LNFSEVGTPAGRGMGGKAVVETQVTESLNSCSPPTPAKREWSYHSGEDPWGLVILRGAMSGLIVNLDFSRAFVEVGL